MLKILQISDPHILNQASDTLMGVNTEYYFKLVLKHAYTRHGGFDLLLATGDLAQSPSVAVYQRLLRHLQEYRTPALCLPGNHDDYGFMHAVLNEGLVSCSKNLQILNWQIICLNSQKIGSPKGLLGAEEFIFLENRLKSKPDSPTLIAVHHHCIPSGSAWLDTMQIINSDALLRTLERYPQVKAITFGHVHQIIAAKHAHFGIFSAPATCFQFKPDSTEFSIDTTPPGYRVFELLDDGGYNTDCFRLDESPRGLEIDAHGY